MRNQSNSVGNGEFSNSFKSAAKSSKTAKKYPAPITLRLTDEERATLKIAASGMSVSAYIRKCLFGADAAPRKRRSYVPVADQEALGRILSMLGQTRIANNLNQIAYHANRGTLLLDEATEAEIKETCAYIAFMRLKLIEALGIKGGH